MHVCKHVLTHTRKPIHTCARTRTHTHKHTSKYIYTHTQAQNRKPTALQQSGLLVLSLDRWREPKGNAEAYISSSYLFMSFIRFHLSISAVQCFTLRAHYTLWGEGGVFMYHFINALTVHSLWVLSAYILGVHKEEWRVGEDTCSSRTPKVLGWSASLSSRGLCWGGHWARPAPWGRGK